MISVCYALPDQQIEIPLQIESNTTVAIAIQRSGILQRFPELSLANMSVGVHAKAVKLDDLLKAGDRIEIYRPLQVDPKQARLLRAAKRKANSARS